MLGEDGDNVIDSLEYANKRIILTTFREAYESLDQILHLVNAWKESGESEISKKSERISRIAEKGLKDFKN